ncbi:ribonuclease HIII [Clostridium intestinale]|uniref:ribonuclease HIII n=1 Tax=Clostridium intestinale TaxID=36845 RepID=UPI0028EF55F1|nr:ribonuclease HIII [Clostridium intestinale]
MNLKDKFEGYSYCKKELERNKILVNKYREINYGLQFEIEGVFFTQTIRIYESKKNGVKIDLSLVKDIQVKELLGNILHSRKSSISKINSPKSLSCEEIEAYEVGNINTEAVLKKLVSGDIEVSVKNKADVEENAIIGTDESGKGDYFGPLVIAGVYADEGMKKELKLIGVADSKKIKDSHIALLAAKIKHICKYEVVVIGNQKYNELYDKVGNLNKLLAWGHARVIENILKETECEIVLSDQFGNPELIKNALLSKGKKIHLEQRPRAEENIVVAAASILARNEFVERIRCLSKKYSIDFPKGVSAKTIEVGKEFVRNYSKESLSSVAKIHFKTTSEI